MTCILRCCSTHWMRCMLITVQSVACRSVLKNGSVRPTILNVAWSPPEIGERFASEAMPDGPLSFPDLKDTSAHDGAAVVGPPVEGSTTAMVQQTLSAANKAAVPHFERELQQFGERVRLLLTLQPDCSVRIM